MRNLLLMGLGLLTGLMHAQDFTGTMTPEERVATGIDRLTPTELDRLKAVIERYKSGEVALASRAAEEELATGQQEAERKTAGAEGRVQPGETQQVAVGKPRAKTPGWFTALVTLQKAGEKPDKSEIMEARLAGKLKSFNGRRSFELQDGQVWRMMEGGSYYGPELDSPAVHISPGFMGIFWLQIREAPLRVKVQPVKVQ